MNNNILTKKNKRADPFLGLKKNYNFVLPVRSESSFDAFVLRIRTVTGQS